MTLLEAVGNFVIVVPDHMDHGIDVKRLLDFCAPAKKCRLLIRELLPCQRKETRLHARAQEDPEPSLVPEAQHNDRDKQHHAAISRLHLPR
jgi:hypothetical protein